VDEEGEPSGERVRNLGEDTRDVVAREIFREQQACGTVMLDATHLGAQFSIRFPGIFRICRARGIDPSREDTVADIGRHMRRGSLADLKPGEFGIVLGGELARGLGVAPGDSVVVITPQGTITPAGTLPRLKSFKVVGVFEVGMYEFDSGLALKRRQNPQQRQHQPHQG